MRAGRQRAKRRAMLRFERCLWALLLFAVCAAAFAVVCSLGGGLLLGEGAVDGLLGQLAVDGAVGDDRGALLELDQHARGAGLVDVCLLEADRRWPVGVAVVLPMELLGLFVGGLGL